MSDSECRRGRSRAHARIRGSRGAEASTKFPFPLRNSSESEGAIALPASCPSFQLVIYIDEDKSVVHRRGIHVYPAEARADTAPREMYLPGCLDIVAIVPRPRSKTSKSCAFDLLQRTTLVYFNNTKFLCEFKLFGPMCCQPSMTL